MCSATAPACPPVPRRSRAADVIPSTEVDRPGARPEAAMKATRADRKKKAPPTPEPARPGFPNRRRLLLAGSVAALVLAGGVWLLLARDDGKPPGPTPEG